MIVKGHDKCKLRLELQTMAKLDCFKRLCNLFMGYATTQEKSHLDK